MANESSALLLLRGRIALLRYWEDGMDKPERENYGLPRGALPSKYLVAGFLLSIE